LGKSHCGETEEKSECPTHVKPKRAKSTGTMSRSGYQDACRGPGATNSNEKEKRNDSRREKMG
jgi:hypothetical protein